MSDMQWIVCSMTQSNVKVTEVRKLRNGWFQSLSPATCNEKPNGELWHYKSIPKFLLERRGIWCSSLFGVTWASNLGWSTFSKRILPLTRSRLAVPSIHGLFFCCCNLIRSGQHMSVLCAGDECAVLAHFTNPRVQCVCVCSHVLWQSHCSNCHIIQLTSQSRVSSRQMCNSTLICTWYTIRWYAMLFYISNPEQVGFQ